MLASSRKPGRGSRRRRKWKAQRLFLARRRNEAKRRPKRRSPSRPAIHDDDRMTPEEVVAKKPEAPKKGLGLLATAAALLGLVTRPFRRGAARGR